MNHPESWPVAELQDLGEWQTGSTPRRSNDDYWDGDILWVSPKDMKTDRIEDTEDKMTEKALEETNSKLIPPGSIVVVTRSGILEHSFPVAVTEEPVTINQDLKAFIPGDGLDERYAYYYLRASELDILRTCTKDGTTVASINSDSLYSYEIPIPPLAHQERIVTKIEELFSKLDSGVSELEDTEKRLEQYRRAVLKAGISGNLSESWRGLEQQSSPTEFDYENIESFEELDNPETDSDYPETWYITTLDQISDVESGATPLRGNDEYWGGDIPWVKSSAVNKDEIEEAEEFITQEALEENTVTLFPPGTLIVAMYGATRGKHSVLTIEATTNQACAGVIIPEEFSFLRSWIDIYLSYYYQDLKRKGSGGAQLNLNLGIIRSIEIPLPPREEIEQICSIVERQMSIIEETSRTISENVERAKRLRQSILKHAFEGKLVPQDPTEEPPTPDGGDTNLEPGEQATLSEVTNNVE